jgi:hypothetical protein
VKTENIKNRHASDGQGATNAVSDGTATVQQALRIAPVVLSRRS